MAAPLPRLGSGATLQEICYRGRAPIAANLETLPLAANIAGRAAFSAVGDGDGDGLQKAVVKP
jgi:hypothetical protein